MNKVGRSISLAFVVLFALPWIYIWLCDPGSGTNERTPAVASVVNSVSAAVGSVVPKAVWYSTFFRDQGAISFADEITRVYGFCTIALVLYLVVYFCWEGFMSGASWPLTDAEQLVLQVPESRSRLRYIENIVLGCGILTIYYDFFGYGLSQPGVLPSESTSGAFVLGAPIFFFAVLALVIIYTHRSRMFLKRA